MAPGGKERATRVETQVRAEVRKGGSLSAQPAVTSGLLTRFTGKNDSITATTARGELTFDLWTSLYYCNYWNNEIWKTKNLISKSRTFKGFYRTRQNTLKIPQEETQNWPVQYKHNMKQDNANSTNLVPFILFLLLGQIKKKNVVLKQISGHEWSQDENIRRRVEEDWWGAEEEPLEYLSGLEQIN